MGALVALALSAPGLAAASSSPEIDAFQADVGDAADAGDAGMQPMPAAPLRRGTAGAARGLESDASPTPSSNPEAARAPPRR